MNLRCLFFVLMSAVCGGCASQGANGSGGKSASADASSSIARIHRTRCGACHVRVEPGTRSRAALQTAFARHTDRVHLSDSEWTAMLDYLAPADTTATNAHAMRDRSSN